MLSRYGQCHLACECEKIASLPLSWENEDYVFCGVSRVDISNEVSDLTGRPAGRYVSISFGELDKLPDEGMDEIIGVSAGELGMLVRHAVGEREVKKILVAGLGNGGITHDSLGARVCARLAPAEGLAVFAVGVEARSGVETARVVKSLSECFGAELVIAVDSLAATGEERVGRVIQLFDGGLTPGSGAGAKNTEINRDFLGVPIVSVGIPTALINNELKERGYLSVGEKVGEICEKGALLISEAIKGSNLF